MNADIKAWKTAPFLTLRIIPNIGLVIKATTITIMAQCQIEKDSMIATFARV
jgi:hypothetical protein